MWLRWQIHILMALNQKACLCLLSDLLTVENRTRFRIRQTSGTTDGLWAPWAEMRLAFSPPPTTQRLYPLEEAHQLFNTTLLFTTWTQVSIPNSPLCLYSKENYFYNLVHIQTLSSTSIQFHNSEHFKLSPLNYKVKRNKNVEELLIWWWTTMSSWR